MSLLNTRLQNFRSSSNLDKNESRPSRYGAFDAFKTQGEAVGGPVTEELKQKAEKSIGNILEVPVIDYDGDVTIGNVRSVTIADDENTSKMHQINFATYAWGFTSVPAMFMNNEIGQQEDFDRKFQKYLFKLGATFDEVGAAALDAAKTQVFEDTLSYPVVANAVVAAYAERDNLLGDINPIMAANDYFQQMHLVGNGGLESIIGKLKQQGVYNDKNKQLEYLDKVLHYSSRIPNEVAEFANMYAVEAGSLGLLARFERESLLGTMTADGHAWDIDNLPMLDFPVGTYFYESVGDYSGIAGAATADLTRARKEHFGFAVDVAFITPYNSDPATIASSIMKLKVSSPV